MNKKKLIFLGLDVLVLVVTIGVSLAVFNYVKKGENPNRVTAGAITMNFTEGVRNISLPVATPTSDEEGKSFGLDGSTCQNDSDNNIQCYTDFTVTTNMNIDYSISYEVTLKKDEETTLENNDVRIYLEKLDENDEYKEVFSPKAFEEIDSTNPTETDELGALNSEMLLDSGSITSSTTYNYRLRIWLAGDYTFTNETKDFVGKINVYGSNVEVNASTGITLDKTTLTMQKGTTNTLTATITPSNAKNQNIIWESSNSNVVKVDSLGNLTAIDVGTSTITVRTSDRSYSAQASITVVNYDATGITLNTSSVTLSKGNTEQLNATVTPNDAEHTGVTWTSSSEGIATVSNSGLVTAVGVGETTITAETENGITSTCKVVVTEPNVNSITLSGSDTVDVGKTIELTSTIASDSLENSNIVWTSSDESKATVTQNGKVTGIAPGIITITASIKEYPDIKAEKEITVQYPEITSITISSDVKINTGKKATFILSLTPSEVRNQEDIIWTSSNTQVAVIPESCKGQLTCELEGQQVGTTTITAKTTDSISATSQLIVTNPSTEIRGNAAEEIVKLAQTGIDTMLADDGTDDHNTRYYGESDDVHNYVLFNDELWRIIGVMNNIKSSASSSNESRVKLVRANIIANASWDVSDSSINEGKGINDWSQSQLMKLLNPGYEDNTNEHPVFGSVLQNNSLYWNSSKGQVVVGENFTSDTVDFSSKGLKETGKKLISPASFYPGQCAYTEHNSKSMYTCEKNSNIWYGYVAIPSASDFGFGSKKCYSDVMLKSYGSDCAYWLKASGQELWTLTINRWANGYAGIHTYTAWNIGSYSNRPLSRYQLIKPAVYLKSDVNIIDGSGTEEDPYILEEGTTNMKLSKYLKKVAQTQTDTMFYDGTSDNNLRYYGASDKVNNYVTFNGETAGWRIIGVFGNKVKLIHSTRLNNANYSWDNSGENGVNDWNRPSALKEMLNTGAYWTKDADGDCPSGSNLATKKCDFSDLSVTPGLNVVAKNMVSESTWYLNSVNWLNEANDTKVAKWYIVERGGNKSQEERKTMLANVGLMYLSDYGYASKSCYNTKPLRVYSGDSGDYRDSDCKKSNWLYLGTYEWTLTSRSDNSTSAFYVNINGIIAEGTTNGTAAIRPTIYLDSNVKRVSGIGTSTDPYVLNDSDYAE